MYDPQPQTLFFRQQLVKHTRKPHKCDYCSRIIPIGSRAMYYAMVDTENGFSHGYHHIQSSDWECVE